jgi:transposase
MDKRMFPMTKKEFEARVSHLFLEGKIKSGRPPNVSDYIMFCALMYVIRTGCAWRDLPKIYGPWHTIYTRFLRGSKSGLWWRILLTLQKKKVISMDVVIIDSTTIDVHRHGSGGRQAVAEMLQG